MQIVNQFSTYPNLTIIEQENKGISVARMKGLTAAKGEYVWFIDSDDWLVQDGVGNVLQLLKDRPNADVLMFPLQWTYEDASKNHLDYRIDGEQTISGKEVLRDLRLPVWASQRFVLKRSLMESHWLFFPEGLIHQDEYFGPVLMYLADTVRVFDNMVYYYRIRPGSITTSSLLQGLYAPLGTRYRTINTWLNSWIMQSPRMIGYGSESVA